MNYLAEYDANVLTAAQWGPLELAGCIFLPAAGLRGGTSLSGVGANGDYWSSSLNTSYSYRAGLVYFNSSNVSRDYYRRYNGQSVRPVSE